MLDCDENVNEKKKKFTGKKKLYSKIILLRVSLKSFEIGAKSRIDAWELKHIVIL